MVPTFLLTFMMNLAFIQGRTEVEKGFSLSPNNQTHLEIYSNALSRAHYNPWTCNYRSEPGYKCLSCSAALHCYPSDFALLVQCAGLFPYCRNGYCSMWKTDGCNEDYMFAEGTHGPLRVTTPSQDTTSPVVENQATEVTTKQVPSENAQATVATPELTTSNEDDKYMTSTAGTTIEPNFVKDPRHFSHLSI